MSDSSSRSSQPALAGAAMLVVLLATGCSAGVSGSSAHIVDGTVHIEDRIEQASIEGFAVPADLPAPLEWDFSEGRQSWGAAPGASPMSLRGGGSTSLTPRMEQTEDALRVHLRQRSADEGHEVWGNVWVGLDDLHRDDWSHVLVTMRTSDPVTALGIAFNRRKEGGEGWLAAGMWRYWGEDAVVVSDGEVHTYRIRADWSGPWFGEWAGPWTDLGLWFSAARPSTFDLLSVTVVPKARLFADAPIGVRTVQRGDEQRRAIYAHAPGKLAYKTRIPEGGQLDVGLGVLSASEPVTFRVRADDDILFDETLDDPDRWAQRSVDLSSYSGRQVTLALEADADEQGAIAFWAAPTLSGRREADTPNIILYVIDGAGADLMSLYGYNRKTTPFMEKLAQEGVVFEYAHTNSGWTKPSTASFMTSLHHSVLGGFASNSDQIPAQAVTMAERFHGAGYQTAVFTSNPFAGSLSGLQRGVDVFRDKGAEPNSGSSAELHRDYWSWRESYPGESYWVHFQTTDVHEPHEPVAPYGGLFVSPERRGKFHEWWQRLHSTDGPEKDTVLGYYVSRLEIMGVDPKEFFDIQRSLYDETMAHNDYQLGRLVERLKQRGEWERTLLIVAADHGHPAGSFSRFGRGLVEPQPEEWEGALADSYRTRIPLMFVWPGHIPAGQRFNQRVSMIDLLPTVLDLAGLPQPEVMQGQSLAPLMLGGEGWEPKPVIFDQFQLHLESGELVGHVEMIDGRWAASLEIVPDSLLEIQAAGPGLATAGGWRAPRPHRPETPDLLLYDLAEDPFCLSSVNEEHPDLVLHYTDLLRAQWEAHRSLAQRFSVEGEVPLTPEQLETLRALGYVQ